MISLLLDFPLPCLSQVDNHRLLKVDSLFNNWNTKEAPGGVAAVILNSQVIYKKAFGMADIGKKIPNSTETAFELASVAKQFTGMCIALLEEQGKLSAEDDIRKFYPNFQFGEIVRIRNLLDHSSGIREAYVLATLSGKINLRGDLPVKYQTKPFLLGVLERERDLNFHAGDEMVYTNVNYVLLGDIVERVSGQTLRQFADSAIFKPLGMKHTFVRDQQKKMAPREAPGYLYNGKKFKKRYPVSGIVGDHNVVTTIDDMTLWMNNFFNNKLGKKDPGLITKISTSSVLNNGDTTHYGYGLYVNKDRGIIRVGHGGDDGRHTCMTTRFPDHKLSVIVLSNSSRYGDTENKAIRIADIFLKGRVQKTAPEKSPENFITIPEAELKKREDLYARIDEHGLGQLSTITVKDGSMHVGGIKLSAVSRDHFVFQNKSGNTLQIHFKDSAGTTVLTSRWDVRPLRRFVAVKKDMKINYADFRGAYHNPSTGATIKVKSKGHKIVARKGIIRIPLVAIDYDTFYATHHDALLIFSRDDKSKVKDMKINARDFRNFRLMKK
jgi:CubicO group peptidase (beta-lactamase class C family)